MNNRFSNQSRRAYLLFFAASIILFLMLALKYFGSKAVIQITGSMPKGLYLIAPREPLIKGQYVIFGFPENVKPMIKKRQWVPSKASLLMKEIVGIPGDKITISDEGLMINGKYYGPVRQYDSQDLPLPYIRKRFTLQEDEYFAACSSDNSFDSRYFGAVNKDQIKGVVKPFIIFND